MNSKKLVSSLVLLASLAGLVSCNPTSTSSTSTPKASDSGSSVKPIDSTSSTDDKTSSSSKTYTPVDLPDGDGETLSMSVTYKDNATRMKFVSGFGALKTAKTYSDPKGNTYQAGDFKPAWKAMQERLDFTIQDDTPTQEQDINKNFSAQVTAGFQNANKEDLNIVQGDASQIISEGTTHDTIVDLSKYLGNMPNFAKFLDDNPVVKATISDANGHIYYAPYFDGYDDLERMLIAREDWVEKLLDGDTLPTTLDTQKQLLAKEYTPFLPDSLDKPIDVVSNNAKSTVNKKYSGGDIIKKMNDLSTLNGSTAVKALRDWIDSTYKNADGTPFYGTKRSELFIGGKAAYDVDELVALFRCVYLNPAFLSGSADNTLIPFFPRSNQTDRNADLWRFAQDFGVRGVESRNGYLYVGSDGTLKDCRDSDEFINAIEKLHQMYSEGLIAQNFDSQSGLSLTKDGGDARDLYNKDLGFAIYDYNQTTVAYNDKYFGKYKDSFKIVPTLPAVGSFDGGSTYIHYTESWRSVKTQGWCITAATAKTPAKLAKALDLFDYLYSTDGNQLMSYGPKEYGYLAMDGENVKTINYQGKQVPQLSDATKSQLADKNIGNSNYTNYYRYFVGATYPVGYVKEQGMEYQTVSSKAIPAFDQVNKAIELGVLQHVNHKKDNTNHLYDIVPTTLPFNTSEQNTISSTYTDLNSVFTMDKKSENVIEDLIKGGFGTYMKYDFSKANFKTTVDTALKLSSYLTLCNTAYTRFKTLW